MNYQNNRSVRDIYPDDLEYGYDDGYEYGYEDLNIPNNNKKPRKNFFKKLIVAGSISALVVGGVAAVSFSIANIITSRSTSKDDVKTGEQTSLSYNTSSSANYWISQRTVSLLFGYSYSSSSNGFPLPSRNESGSTAGTGWIYQADQSSNTFYIATNLHVANILSFLGHSVTSYSEESSSYVTNTYSTSNFQAYVGIAIGLTENVNNYSNTIAYFPVSKPEVVYTTTSDSNFNNLFNKTISTSSANSQNSASAKNYYGVGRSTTNGQSLAEKFYGAVDIAVLKYTINPNTYTTSSGIRSNQNDNLDSSSKSTYITTFKDWISTYFNNPTTIYTDYIDQLSSLSTQKLYMAGFPAYNSQTHDTGSSLSDITWLGFSDFTVATSVNGSSNSSLSTLNYDGNEYLSNNSSSYLNSPIAFYSSSSSDSSSGSSTTNDYTDYNYISIGVSSYLEASSFSGSSGSPVVIQDSNGSFKIAGIYWGGVYFGSSSSSYKKGIMTWFSTNSYKLGSSTISYNLTTYISSAISSSSPSTSETD
ncbi:conserved hypothetical protein [Malacoplasma penetrans HF-2]|uniref:Peptidase S1 domain-containing protein n=1 Tax=Malacoplasma penetrans (strain HF-2) TaxID=272633 RepID=Q8EUT1_MALP2|nr:hypothetical protein [Malacoplasma penetrans]BAC44631.1 conserved hypothetical protein [Malacoplasma penetrans HF-2]